MERRCILVVSRPCSMLLLIQKEPPELYYIKLRKVHLPVDIPVYDSLYMRPTPYVSMCVCVPLFVCIHLVYMSHSVCVSFRVSLTPCMCHFVCGPFRMFFTLCVPYFVCVQLCMFPNPCVSRFQLSVFHFIFILLFTFCVSHLVCPNLCLSVRYK